MVAETGGIAAVQGITPPASTAVYFEGAWAKPEIIGPFACCGYDIAPGVLFNDAYDGYLLGSKRSVRKCPTWKASSARVPPTWSTTTAGAANPGRHRCPLAVGGIADNRQTGVVTFDGGMVSCRAYERLGPICDPAGLDRCRPGVGRATASRPYLGDLHAMAIVTPGPSLADIRQTSLTWAK